MSHSGRHTPGPWKVDADGGSHRLTTWIRDVEYGDILATIEPQLASSLTEPANARLIAAAPELLEALIELNEKYRPESGTTEEHQLGVRIETLIKKATGGAE